MKSWQIHSYGEDLQLGEARIPFITNPEDVLVKVEAASVNPIDRIMLGKLAFVLFSLVLVTLVFQVVTEKLC